MAMLASIRNKRFSHECAAVPKRAHIQGSKTFVSLNSRPESNQEEENTIFPAFVPIREGLVRLGPKHQNISAARTRFDTGAPRS